MFIKSHLKRFCNNPSKIVNLASKSPAFGMDFTFFILFLNCKLCVYVGFLYLSLFSCLNMFSFYCQNGCALTYCALKLARRFQFDDAGWGQSMAGSNRVLPCILEKIIPCKEKPKTNFKLFFSVIFIWVLLLFYRILDYCSAFCLNKGLYFVDRHIRLLYLQGMGLCAKRKGPTE